MITLSALDGMESVHHAFFTREGGVSEGVYASLNCGFGSRDDPARVAENRARAMGMIGMPVSALTTVHQEHTARAVIADRAWSHGEAPVADAMATAVPGVVLGILTADCAPVLLADGEARVIGAAHAGWRGASGGILEAVVDAMESLGARRSRIVAAVGPCIAWKSYEVGPEFPAPLLSENPDNAVFFVPARREGHFLFDLPGYAARRLGRAEVGTVVRSPHDTLAEEDRFFSYRRTTLRGEADYGRGLSAIVLAP